MEIDEAFSEAMPGPDWFVVSTHVNTIPTGAYREAGSVLPGSATVTLSNRAGVSVTATGTTIGAAVSVAVNAIAGEQRRAQPGDAIAGEGDPARGVS